MSDLESTVEIRNTEVNVGEIRQRIERRLQQRRAEALAQGLDYDHLTHEISSPDSSGRFAAEFRADLNYLHLSADSLFVSMAVRDEPVPLIRPLIRFIKEAFHSLTILYVNMLAGRQIAFNFAAAHMIDSLVRVLGEQDVRIQSLERKIAELERRQVETERVSSPKG